MKSFRRHAATVNAGSMADIAFLLLIFFLVTTTISADKGILRKLPSLCPPGDDCITDLHERNVLRISLNNKQEVFIEDAIVDLEDVSELVLNFVDNNGVSQCEYCHGQNIATLSDHPTKAVISLKYDALTKYDLFVAIQDEVTDAYYDLRARYAKDTFNKIPQELTKSELEVVKKAYPFIISEVLINR